MERKNEIRQGVFLALIYVAALASIQADTIILTDGQEIDGAVIGVTDAQVIHETHEGNLVLSKSDIDSVFIGPDYRAADSATRERMLKERRAQMTDDRPDSTESSGDDGADADSASAANNFSYLWFQIGLADAKDFVRPLIDHTRRDSIILQTIPYGNAREDIAAKQFHVDAGFLQLIPYDLFF